MPRTRLNDACVIATAAYRRAGPVSTVKNGGATFDVMRIVVVGVYTVNGLEQSLPTEFFTLIPHDEQAGTVGQSLGHLPSGSIPLALIAATAPGAVRNLISAEPRPPLSRRR